MKKVILTALALSSTAAYVSADTVGYWRFESGSFTTDSSSFGNNLTSNGSGSISNPSNTVFSNPIPQTGQANNNLADLQSGGNTDQFFSVGNQPEFGTGDFSIETFIRPQSNNNFRVLASIWDNNGGSTDEQFRLIISSSNFLQLQFTDGSGSFQNANSNGSGPGISTLASATNYYVSAIFDTNVDLGLGSVGANDTRVTFYTQDLSTSTLNIGTVDFADVNGLLNSTTDFRIGAQGNGAGGATSFTDGFMDEVRFSNTALSQSELLITIPEPSTYVTVFGALALAIVGIRRRR